MLIDLDAILLNLEEIVNHYEKSAPVVSNYADDVYIRLSSGKPVQITELTRLDYLKESESFVHPNLAQNIVVHSMNHHGISTTGLLSY